MLILSRRPGDAIVIDGGIRIVVLASGQRCVRLGIEAPSEIGIVREEVLTRAETRAASDVVDATGTLPPRPNGKHIASGQ